MAAVPRRSTSAYSQTEKDVKAVRVYDNTSLSPAATSLTHI